MYGLSSHFIRTSFAFFFRAFLIALLCVCFSDKRPISYPLTRPSLDSSAGRAEDCSWLLKTEILRSLVQIRFERSVFFENHSETEVWEEGKLGNPTKKTPLSNRI